MLTIRELIAELGLPLVAGAAGQDAPIRWVHLSELADPTPWLSGGEVLLTSGLALDTEEAQRRYVELLADHGLAGVGFATGFQHAAVPAALTGAAEDRGFPIFEVPYETPFIAITEAAFRQLVSDEYALLRRALRAQEQLEQLVLAQQGLGPLTAALAKQLGCEVLVLDRRGEPLAGRSDQLETLRFAVRDRVRRGERQPFIPRDGALALPVDAHAWLVVVGPEGQLSDFERLLLRQAVTIVALELLRERVELDTERRLAGDVMAALLAGELTEGELARRLEPFGLSGGLAALVSAAPGFADAVRAEGERGLIAPAGPLVCALLPGRPDSEFEALARRVAERCGDVGLGRVSPPGQARRSFQEARCALEAVALSGGDGPHAGRSASMRNGHGHGGRVATFRDLGSFQLLLSLQDEEALKLFCDSILGPIERGDDPYGGELIRSLEAFIEENGQWERAAKRLYCHRHTLRYRIRRVEELTGRDLGSARDRIEFWLALRGREFQ